MSGLDATTRLDIHDLYFAYAAGNDERDIAAIGECFTVDGSFSLQITGQDPVGPFRGRAAVLDFMGTTLGAQSDQRRHVMTNIRLRPLPDGVVFGTCYFTLLVTDGGITRVATTGVYRDSVEFTDGAWRFATKRLDLDGQF